MELKLTYSSIRELFPLSKEYFNLYLKPSKIWEMILATYVVVSLLFYPYFRTIVKDLYLIIIYLCIFLFYSMRYLYAVLFYKKYNQTRIKIDFDKNLVYVQKKDGYIIDKEKSKVLNENSILLVIEKNTLKIGIPITTSCNHESIKKINDYLSFS